MAEEKEGPIEWTCTHCGCTWGAENEFAAKFGNMAHTVEEHENKCNNRTPFQRRVAAANAGRYRKYQPLVYLKVTDDPTHPGMVLRVAEKAKKGESW